MLLKQSNPISGHVVTLMKPHSLYFELCFNSGATFFEKQNSQYSVDKNILISPDSEIINFWKFVRDHPQIFLKSMKEIACNATCFKIWRDDARVQPNSMTSAMRFFILNRMSRADGSYDEKCERGWQAALDQVYNASLKLGFTHLQWTDSIKIFKENSQREDALIFIEPPFKRKLESSTNFFDHESMVKLAVVAKSKVIIQGYESELYRTFLTGISGIEGEEWILRKFGEHFVWRNYK